MAVPTTRDRSLRAWLACLAAVGLLAATLLPAGSAVLAAEPTVVTLPGASYGGMVADLDGDGRREVLRLTRASGGRGDLAVEAWRLQGDEWQPIGEAPLRRGAVIPDEEQFADGDVMRPLLVNEPARLFTWRDGGRERVVVATIGTREFVGRCCLSLFEVHEGDRGLELRVLRGADGTTGFGTALALHPIDLDGDGTDELLVTEPPQLGGIGRLRVLRWTPDGWESTFPRAPQPMGQATPSFVGDFDGRPGEEAIFVVDLAGDTNPAVRLLRVGGPASDPHVDVADLSSLRPLVAPGLTLHGREDLLVQASQDMIFVVEWPRDAPVQVRERRHLIGWLIGAVGEGSATSYLMARPEVHPAGVLPRVHLEVVGRALEPRFGVAPSSAVVSLDDAIDRMRGGRIGNVGPPRPYVGPLPGGMDGRDAFVFAGQLVIEGDPMPSVQEVAALAAVTPLGLAGDPDRSWLALADGTIGDPAPRGGTLDSFVLPGGEIRLVSSEVALRPESPQPGTLPGELVGAIAGQAASTLYVGPDGFDVQLELPPGSRVMSIAGRLAREHEPDEAGLLAVHVEPPPGEEDGPTRYEASIVILTPFGGALVHSWDVHVLDDAPRIDVLGETEPLALAARVSGAVSAPARVLVDGSVVEVGEDGSFEASVDAMPWPRPVRVEATDPLGNRSVAVVHVVGLVDYREWPWALIVAVLTVAAGAFLYLRGWQVQSSRAPEGAEAATLEEIERQR